MNPVSWATPRLTYDEGIQMVMDDRIGEDYPLVAVEKGKWCYALFHDFDVLLKISIGSKQEVSYNII
ncbi:hypothetical protein SASPL_138899 [Salvia splendens]|uniref:Uncharacterized protein n=1 Tax=Salvia splendens TaxID=180675 RepID=A0A8X8ZFH2_SALSN|nr:hypothetical protein SASPL_138899 [Salvia splendens]